MSEEKRVYVTNSAWLRRSSRVDAIDDVADQFERADAGGGEAFWADQSARRHRGGWRSVGRLHGRTAERQAG